MELMVEAGIAMLANTPSRNKNSLNCRSTIALTMEPLTSDID
jgi:hypothetical protein